MLLSDFHCKENDRFWVISVHPGLVTCDYGVHVVGVTVYRVLQVLGVRVQPKTLQKPLSIQLKYNNLVFFLICPSSSHGPVTFAYG